MVAVDNRAGAPPASAAPAWGRWPSITVPALILAVAGWNRRWVSEDGFISLRVVRQLLSGNGPVFNAGERVEAATSPLWTFALAAADVIAPFRLEVLAVLLGIMGSVLGLVLATVAAQRLWPVGGDATFLPLGALLVAVLPPFWDFATSGLETGLAFAWIGGSALLLARCGTGGPPRHPWAVAALLGLGPMVRPDLALFSGCFLVAFLFLERSSGHRRLRGLLGAAAALPAAYQIFRMGYYANLVPNPALAKEASQPRWSQGLHYLGNLTGPYRLGLPLLGAGLATTAMMRRAPRPVTVAAVAPIIGGLLHGLYVVRVGGDFMHARLLLPSLFGCLIPVMAVPWSSRAARVAVAVVAAWALVFGTGFETPQGPGGHGITDEAAFWRATAGDRNPVGVDDYAGSGHHLDATQVRQQYDAGARGFAVRPDVNVGKYVFLPFRSPGPGPVGMEEPHVGIVGYMLGTDVYVYDKLGLGDAVGAHARLVSRGRPGHEKNLDRAWIWAQLVDDDASPIPSGPSPEMVAAARQALGCSDLHKLTEAVGGQLTPGRFIRNLFGAPALYKFRFDPQPQSARDRLCGR